MRASDAPGGYVYRSQKRSKLRLIASHGTAGVLRSQRARLMRGLMSRAVFTSGRKIEKSSQREGGNGRRKKACARIRRVFHV